MAIKLYVSVFFFTLPSFYLHHQVKIMMWNSTLRNSLMSVALILKTLTLHCNVLL